jgi:nucleoside-diphosphate-sugar epimerase
MTPFATLSGSTVLVTGARGFLASHLCAALTRVNSEIHATSREAIDDGVHGIKWHKVDLADTSSVRRLVGKIKPDVIFHLSGLSTAKPGLEFILPALNSLVTSTVNLLVAATEIGCQRIVLPASLTEPAPSMSEAVPSSPYAAAKWCSSSYGRTFHQLYNTPVVIVRIYQTYGPRQDTRKLIPSVILSLLNNQPPQLSNGRWQVDYIYIDDVIEGLLAAACAPGIEGGTIDLGTGRLVSVETVVRHLVQIVDADVQPVFGVLPDRPAEPVRVADVKDAEWKLNWRSVTSLESGLHQTVDWYKNRLTVLQTAIPAAPSNTLSISRNHSFQ